MNHRFVRYIFVVLMVACSLHGSRATAQDQPAPGPDPGSNTASFGAGLTMKSPSESFGVQYNTGYGLMAFMEYPFIPLLDVTAGIGWNHFPEGDANEALDIWEFVAGARLRLGVFFMSGEAGYYTQIKETSFLPGLGLRFTHLELALNIRAVPSGSWLGMRLGFYF